ncbi:hypothetical protein M8J76_005731 [Diaphorina citri]|nr:hypothetical protein M8J76_005731 [Diaphorina citri]
MNGANMFWSYSIVFITILSEVLCSGVFELRLKSFSNDYGKDNLGQCCSGERNTTCRAPCRTSFRVCLKHYQAQIDTTSGCTFGDIVTPVLGANNVNLDDIVLKGFSNPIRFPFDFTWPGTFSLIVEAWHDTNSSSENGVTSGGKTLISRLTTQRWLDVGPSWTEDEHKSAHSSMLYEYRVTCDPHYYGNGCATLCRPRDDSFGHYTCSHTGDRKCLPGWSGDYCTKAKCLPGCDEQHGHCNKPDECLCHSGWKGKMCDQCERYPGCLHGSCHKPWECLCDEGWGGLFCNQDLNYCTNHKPCKNGGTCFNTGQGSYTCTCPPGFNGTDCENKLNRNIGTNKPPCDEDESGLCKPLDQCSSRPCLNGGSCTVLDTGFSCSCPIGFQGNQCEENINDCPSINTCQNGGTCVDLVNDYKCQCVPGYVGPRCDVKVAYCLAKPCANGGVCEDLVNDFICRCKAGFSGKDCSNDIDECASNPCANAGVCRDLINGFKCECSPGWHGATCQEDIANPGNMSRHVSVRVEPESGLNAEHVIVISTLSIAIPLVVLIAVSVVFCTKLRRKQEQRRADDEARAQNEQNAVHSHVVKLGDTHMIKNTWGQQGGGKKVETNNDLCYAKSYYI